MSSDLLAVAREAAAAGAAVAMQWRERSDELRIQEKAASDDLVSQADRDAEAAILQVISRHRPDDAVLAEETGRSDGSTGVCWVVDPIDGTTSYLYGRPDWTVSVAAVSDDGTVLVGVVDEPVTGCSTYAATGQGTRTESGEVRRLQQDDLSRALVELNLGRPDQRPAAGAAVDALVGRVRDVRRGGSAALALAGVARGRADAAWVPGLSAWDCAAGVLLVVAAGGLVGDLTGPTGCRVPDSGDVLAAPPRLWPALRELLLPVYA